jgi:hypothetical protein
MYSWLAKAQSHLFSIGISLISTLLFLDKKRSSSACRISY